MSQEPSNPYAHQYEQPAAGGNFDDPFSVQAQSTSLLAIFAIICSSLSLVICCIPGVGLIGVLGVVLGVLSLIAIGTSGGTKGGRGIAITAIVLGSIAGILNTLLLIGAFYGWGVYRTASIDAAELVYPALETDDWATARLLLDSQASARYSDAELAAFRDAYVAAIGNYSDSPRGIFEVFGIAAEVSAATGATLQTNSNNMEHVYAHNFDSGSALAIYKLTTPWQGTSLDGFVDDITLSTPDGEFKLSDFDTE
ncbi:MAG: hypothetical protein AAF747_07640 [Planctomycetota bacterium]